MEKTEFYLVYSETKKMYYLSVWDFEKECFKELARGAYFQKGLGNVYLIGNSENDCSGWCITEKGKVISTPVHCSDLELHTAPLYVIGFSTFGTEILGLTAKSLESGKYVFVSAEDDTITTLGAKLERCVFVNSKENGSYDVSVLTNQGWRVNNYRGEYQKISSVWVFPRTQGRYDLVEAHQFVTEPVVRVRKNGRHDCNEVYVYRRMSDGSYKLLYFGADVSDYCNAVIVPLDKRRARLLEITEDGLRFVAEGKSDWYAKIKPLDGFVLIDRMSYSPCNKKLDIAHPQPTITGCVKELISNM